MTINQRDHVVGLLDHEEWNLQLGIPESWQQSPLLRNNFPLRLGEDGRWLVDPTVRLDAALGLTYDNET